MLDPSLRIPYPTSIFVRASAIIVNFESIRLVIAHDRVLVLSVPVPEQGLLHGMPARWGGAYITFARTFKSKTCITSNLKPVS